MAYVYRHIRLDKNEPFYIGIGSDSDYKRANELRNARRNPIWHKIACKTEIEVEIVLDDLTYEDAIAKEIEFIGIYGRLDKGNGILSNLTDGGEGTLGVIVCEETKRKNSERFKGKGNPMYGKTHPRHLIEQIRLKNIGKKAWNKGKKNVYTIEQIKKMSEAKKGILAWNKGKKNVNGLGKAKIVINLESGIFYESCKEASEIYGYKHSTLKSKLNGINKNNTSLIYA
jgi:hypothetical protein